MDKEENEAPRSNDRGIFSPLLRRERNPSEAEISSHSSPGSRPRFSAKGDKDYQIAYDWKNIGKVVASTSLIIVVLVSLVFGISKIAEKYAEEPEKVEEKVGEDQTQEELKIEDVKVGNGSEVKDGNTVSVNYRGALTDGREFDNSYDRGQPFEFKVGAGEVIKGWDQGLLGMKVGGKRKLVIPPGLGYGERGAGADIPPNATLVFEIELLKIKD